jgi:repressor LexA
LDFPVRARKFTFPLRLCVSAVKKVFACRIGNAEDRKKMVCHRGKQAVDSANEIKTGTFSMSELHYLIPKHERPILEQGEWLDPVAIDLVEVPLLGWVSAGSPVELNEDQQTVSVPANMVRRNSYALKVRGHSMIDDNIQDGDIIIIEKRESAQNGQSVVAMINGETVTLKRFYVEKDGIRLQPANPAMEAIWLRNEEVQILGIVTGVIRTPE